MIPLIIILACKLLQPLLNKQCSLALDNTASFMKLLAIRQLVAALFATFFAGNLLTQIRGATLLFGALFAFFMTTCVYTGIVAMRHSAIVLVSLFETAGLLVPCLLGIFLFDEPLKGTHVLGIAVCLLSAWLLTGKNNQNHRLSGKDWILLILCLLSNGGIMLTQKLFSSALPEGDIGAFHFLGFFFSALFSLPFCFSSKTNNQTSKLLSPKNIFYGILLSVAMLTISMLSTLVAAKLSSVVLFSITGGGGLLLSTLVSVLVYKEKITTRMIVGLVLGVLALMVITI